MAFNMDARSKDIIRRRLILGQTLEQIGQHYGLTRERVRQLEFLAVATIRKRLAENKKLKQLVKRYGFRMVD